MDPVQDFIRRMFMNQTGAPPPIAPMTAGVPQAGPQTPMAPMARPPAMPMAQPATPGMPAGADAAKMLQALMARRKQKPSAGAMPMAPPPGLIGSR